MFQTKKFKNENQAANAKMPYNCQKSDINPSLFCLSPQFTDTFAPLTYPSFYKKKETIVLLQQHRK